MTFLLAAVLAVLTLLFPSGAEAPTAGVQVAVPSEDATRVAELFGTWTATFDGDQGDAPLTTTFSIEQTSDRVVLRASSSELVEIQHAVDGGAVVFAANSEREGEHRPHPTQLTGRVENGVMSGTLYSPERRALVTWRATRP